MIVQAKQRVQGTVFCNDRYDAVGHNLPVWVRRPHAWTILDNGHWGAANCTGKALLALGTLSRRRSNSWLLSQRLLAHGIDPLRSHLSPPLQVIFRHCGPPRREQGGVRGRQNRRGILLRKAGDLSQQLPVARYRDLGHAPPEKSIERFDMEGTRRPGHL
jgi:hypothetical protein